MAVSSSVNGTGPVIRNKLPIDVDMAGSLKELQTVEQCRTHDIVAQVRKCGLDSILSLPQLVVCGDQSAKRLHIFVSSVDPTLHDLVNIGISRPPAPGSQLVRPAGGHVYAS